jgi:glutaredoxin
VEIVKVEGEDKRHKVLLYTISTCAWCKKTKKFLKEKGVHYEYIDVDLCTQEEREKIREKVIRKAGRSSYPTIIIDDEKVIVGFHEDQIEKDLDL